MIEFPTNLGWVPMPWLNGKMHQIFDRLKEVQQSLVLYEAIAFITISIISAVICFIISSIHLSKIIVSGRTMIVMKPSAVMMCLTLMAYFAGPTTAVQTTTVSWRQQQGGNWRGIRRQIHVSTGTSRVSNYYSVVEEGHLPGRVDFDINALSTISN